MHKAQSDRIGISGGSTDSTSAQYFAGMNALKVSSIPQLITVCRELKTSPVLDVDALFLIKYYPDAILTPNVVEFSLLFAQEDQEYYAEKLNENGASETVLKKRFCRYHLQ